MSSLGRVEGCVGDSHAFDVSFVYHHKNCRVGSASGVAIRVKIF